MNADPAAGPHAQVQDGPIDAEFSMAALSPGMAAEHLLGIFTDSKLDLGASHAQTVPMLAALDARAAPYVDGDGCTWILKAQADDATGQAVAWAGGDVVLASSDKHDRLVARLGCRNALSLQSVVTSPSSRLAAPASGAKPGRAAPSRQRPRVHPP